MRIFDMKELGVVKITKRKASRNIRMSINTRGEIAVSSPLRVSYNQSLAFVWQNKEWIEKQRAKQQARLKNECIFMPGKIYATILNGLTFQLIQPKNEIKVVQEPSLTSLLLPAKYKHTNDKIQDFIKREYMKIIQADAQLFLPERLNQLAEQYGFHYQRVSIRNQRTRWGSCSTRGNINLNMHLVRLPQELLDMVLLHELCHTIQPNHGKPFYQLLYSILPNYKQLHKRIKNYKFDVFHACDELP